MSVRRFHAAHEHVEAHEHAANHSGLSPEQRRKAVMTAILAAVIALLSIWGEGLNREILLARDEASNRWAYFHEKSLKERIYESELSFAVDLAPTRIRSLNADIKRYQEEAGEIRVSAEEKEVEVQNLLEKIHNVELATVLAELAIILISVSLIIGVVWLEILAGVAVLVGIGLAVMTL